MTGSEAPNYFFNLLIIDWGLFRTMAAENAKPEIIIVPSRSLPTQPWWPELHPIIIESFLNKNYSVFPPTWTRLDLDIIKGAEGLANELGDNGHFAVAFTKENKPVACGGVLPFRGENWINEAFTKTDAELSQTVVKTGDGAIPQWEICCFCVQPAARGTGLSHQLIDNLVDFIKAKGATKLFTNYAKDETGRFWPRMGFEVIPGAGGMLPKGFQTDPAKEGLRADIHFGMGVKTI